MLPLALSAQQETAVTEFNLSGPFAVSTPFATDTVDMHGKKFDDASLLGALNHKAVGATKVYKDALLPSLDNRKSVGLLTFYVNNSSYLKAKLTVKGPKNYMSTEPKPLPTCSWLPSTTPWPSSIWQSQKTPIPFASQSMLQSVWPIRSTRSIPIWYTI